jgi:hypothetical protein
LKQDTLVANIVRVLDGGPVKAPKLDRKELLRRVVHAVESGQYRILPHARQRCSERDVSVPDIEAALENGRHVPRRDRFDERLASWSYCFEGESVDRESLRVVVALEDWMLVVTVVLLDRSKED